ncbi:MAG: dephospho-CoA kinase [Desulfobacter sp.]|nr:MAG: dephospho-CoA kinase [Desulfobacter sp.]
MFKIGVTGSAGSGKSLARKGFEKLGLKTLDCDQIARQVVEPEIKAYKKVVALFGTDVVAGDLSLDRARLRNIMVNRPGMRKQLESIVHPAIVLEMAVQMEAMARSGQRVCVVEVPLLFELGMEDFFDLTLVVAADDDQLVKRISARDDVDPDNAKKMLALQMDQEEKMKRADHVIFNHGDKEAVFRAVAVLYEKEVKERLTKNS